MRVSAFPPFSTIPRMRSSSANKATIISRRISSKFMRGKALLANQVRSVPLVFQADVIQQFRIEHDGLSEVYRPRLGIRFGIVDRKIDLQRPVVHAVEPLRHLGRTGQWAAAAVEPLAVLETFGLDHQR